MADIRIINPVCCGGCDDEGCSCERSKQRGKRGKRGKQGRRGDDGPAGAPAAELIKFSGQIQTAFGATPRVSFLADAGIDVGVPLLIPTSYPVAIDRNLRDMATNLLFTVQAGQFVTFDLVKNLSTAPVVIASITYGPAESGIKTTSFGPEFLAGSPTPDTLDLRVTTTASATEDTLNASATVGVE